MDAAVLVAGLADTARKAARTLVTTTGAERKAALLAIADEIQARSAEIVEANSKDVERAKTDGTHPQTIDRLLLNAERVAGIANGARLVANLEDPLGRTIR